MKNQKKKLYTSTVFQIVPPTTDERVRAVLSHQHVRPQDKMRVTFHEMFEVTITKTRHHYHPATSSMLIRSVLSCCDSGSDTTVLNGINHGRRRLEGEF